MSQYAEDTELFALGLPSAALADVSSETITAALVAASGDADGYLAKRYKLPLVEWGDDLTRRVAALAAFDLLTTRGSRPGDGLDLITKRADDATLWLRDVSRGIIEPQGIVDSTPTLDEQHPIMSSADPLFKVGEGIWDDGTT